MLAVKAAAIAYESWERIMKDPCALRLLAYNTIQSNISELIDLAPRTREEQAGSRAGDRKGWKNLLPLRKRGDVHDFFVERFSAGMIGVNIGVPVPREPFSFGGINRSKFGQEDITGDDGFHFYTELRKVTTKWNPPEDKTWLN
ncbi:hypothetical protein BJ742DRAFT_768455 [Cladochytrium replicatum]|nr:hypothetical protein BJ742DRAFT_768455 [Cladochytrium replicatum]